MLVSRDLGFTDLILVFFVFVVVPVVGLGFFVRRKWKLAVARREEIKRLLVLASEEAARAELEAAVEYGAAVSVAREFQCAVCFCPTTTRCSRCKAVRYCSGKCQIIHWRQGHKDECRPQSTPISISHVNDFGEKAVSGDECEFSSDNLETEGIHSNEIETSKEEPATYEVLGRKDDTIKPLVDPKTTGTVSESSGGSLSTGFFTSTGTNESLVDVSVCEIPVPSTSDRVEGLQTNITTADKLESSTDVKDMKLTKSLPSEFNSSVNSVNCSSSSKLKQEKSSFNAGEDNYNSAVYSPSSSTGSLSPSTNACMPAESTACSDFWGPALDLSGYGVHDDSAYSSIREDGDDVLSDSGSLLCSSKNLSGRIDSSFPSQRSKPETVKSSDPSPTSFKNATPATGAAPSRKMVTDLSRISSLPASSSERSKTVANESRNDTQLLKSKTVRSFSSSASDLPSTKVENSVQSVRNGSPEVASSSPNVGNGLKTSVRKVVQQFRSSKISVYNPLGLGTEVAGKYNCKMVFPYELFLKLYNSDKLEFRPFGLTNCGNSCYANAVLQCLAFTKPLTAYLLQGLHSKACSKKEWCFSCEFEDLILKAKEGKSPLSPIGILSQIQSIGSHLGRGREEDAHEFLRYAIDTMQSVCLKEAGVNVVDQMAEETTLVGLIFGGYLRSKIKCLKCQGKSERHERMMDLTVEIQGDIGTLEEALAQFTATETLDGDNKYHCGRCKSYEKAKKKLTVLEAPNILTIVLKRFQSGKFGKLNKSVQFPEILNLAPYMSGTSDKSPIYRLYAVVVHLDIMNAAFSGHYVCYVRNFQGKWFKIDDSTVKPVELDRVLSKGAYMLLYARFSPRAPSLIRKSMISSDNKMKRSRFSEAVNNNGKSTTSKSRTNIVPSTGPAMVHRVPEGYAPWMTKDGGASFDSLSDNSSLFSCSDEGSCSTESTRDSTSTEDFSDYIFADAGRSWNIPLGVLSDSDGSSSSLCSLSPPVNLKRHEPGSPETSGYPAYIPGSVPEADGILMRQPQESSRKQDWQGKGNPDSSLLHPDTTKQCRKSSNQCSSSDRCSSCRETDSEKLGWVNPFDVRSGVSLRRSTRERPTQTFY
ncbi:ubiquitin carboxyl-terminal hydrolase 16-like isoform X2 [Telopea speciosissima]|uniref:ubiquitin carboxyl-terminal hydrolase 16-like isoform X2 n=1 Tax=Telopea speciosissima TaxID=54955 RepID=UPI001CC7121E|nr:ubiquitin carboxyl-terminal hydrolase 16-like isoform X2 [Telopea speciosissima]